MKKGVQNGKMNDFRFNVTEEMNNAFIEMLLVKEMLNNPKNKGKDRKLLEQHYNQLSEFFVGEFRKNNVKERVIYNKLMNQ